MNESKSPQNVWQCHKTCDAPGKEGQNAFPIAGLNDDELEKILPADRCQCGRWMTTVFGTNTLSPDGYRVRWCSGCGVVTVHQGDSAEHSRYTPNPKHIGKK